MNNKETSQAVIGTLLLRPGRYLEISHLVKPEMFTAELLPAAREIWKREGSGRAYDIASIVDAIGWDRGKKNEILAAANPNLLQEHATQLRDAWLAQQEVSIMEQAAAELIAGSDYWEVSAKTDYQRDKLREFINVGPFDKTNLINAAINQIEQARLNDGLSGITTGWNDTDQYLGGWQNGDLIIIGGRPGMGKTTILMHHARAAAETGVPVAIFSLEMSASRLVKKWVGEASGITAGMLRNGDISDKQMCKIREEAERLHDIPVRFVDTAEIQSTSFSAIRDRARLLHDRGELGLLMVDYLQLMKGDDDRKSRNYQVEDISRGLKYLAQTLDIPVIALSQLSRDVEKRGGTKRPMMSDLRDSGSVEQDADIIIFLYRPEYYQIIEDEEGLSLKGVLEYSVTKDRDGGIPAPFRRYWQYARYHENLTHTDDFTNTAMPFADTSKDVPF